MVYFPSVNTFLLFFPLPEMSWLCSLYYPYLFSISYYTHLSCKSAIIVTFNNGQYIIYKYIIIVQNVYYAMSNKYVDSHGH